MRTWATGGRPDRGSNISHTETQFFRWFKEQGADFHKRVVSVELRSVYSPCGDCVSILGGISELLEERAPGARPATKVMFWDTLYGEEGEGAKPKTAATFPNDIGELGGAGWILHGPTPEPQAPRERRRREPVLD